MIDLIKEKDPSIRKGDQLRSSWNGSLLAISAQARKMEIEDSMDWSFMKEVGVTKFGDSLVAEYEITEVNIHSYFLRTDMLVYLREWSWERKFDLTKVTWEMPKGHSCWLNVQGCKGKLCKCLTLKEILSLVAGNTQPSEWVFLSNRNMCLYHTVRAIPSLNYIFMQGVHFLHEDNFLCPPIFFYNFTNFCFIYTDMKSHCAFFKIPF